MNPPVNPEVSTYDANHGSVHRQESNRKRASKLQNQVTTYIAEGPLTNKSLFAGS